MQISKNLVKSYMNIRKTLFMTLVLFMLVSSIFSFNVQAQTSQSLYLNRVGFLDIEVGYDVHVVENYAYVTNNEGLMIIDIQDPNNPQKVGEILSGGSFGVEIESDTAYIASSSGGFIISNITDPRNPDVLGQDSVGGATKIAISGSYAYVTYSGAGFKIFNISDPTNPVFLGEFSDTRSDAIEIKGKIAYFANAEVGLKVVNVSNPSSPQLLTTVSQTGGANDIHITNDDILYLGCWGAGIRVIDISNPNSPQLLDSYIDNDGGEELGLVERDDLLYVADNSGIEVFNVSETTSIVEIAERTNDVDAAHDIDVDGEYIYVALGGGLLILKVSNTPESDPWLIYLIIMVVSVGAGVGILSLIYYKILKPRKGRKEEI